MMIHDSFKNFIQKSKDQNGKTLKAFAYLHIVIFFIIQAKANNKGKATRKGKGAKEIEEARKVCQLKLYFKSRLRHYIFFKGS